MGHNGCCRSIASEERTYRPFHIQDTDPVRSGRSLFSDVGTEAAQKLKDVDLIIWDEIAMCNRHCLEAVERTLRDVMNNSFDFGYKACLLYTSPSPRDKRQSRMPSSA